ncbi:DUF503 family protein [Hydrogenimonas cancrithermarum]|uniref:DUF503 domain-containing protein n=1 Tax=Hydrogenimonas cancrithermarum TaxID=2993563 RepID=A0ABN6WZL9_9BACT|nr:DUF503 family protein [Hydrogenimonas cancrithermarum]BDY13904.1 hypothetical protein HCR_22160 [Hydrogenimonas cancrithermarum]
MTLTYATLTIDLPYVSSKKGRRAILNAIKDRLAALNCSVLDISGEYPKEAEIAIAFLSPDEQQAKQKIEKIETMLETRFPEIEAELSYESI